MGVRLRDGKYLFPLTSKLYFKESLQPKYGKTSFVINFDVSPECYPVIKNNDCKNQAIFKM